MAESVRRRHIGDTSATNPNMMDMIEESLSPLQKRQDESNEDWRRRIESMSEEEQLQAALTESMRVQRRVAQVTGYDAEGRPIDS